jgi:hypothetical protein
MDLVVTLPIQKKIHYFVHCLEILVFFYLMASFERLLHHFTCSWYGVGSGENDGSGENAGETTEKHENWD